MGPKLVGPREVEWALDLFRSWTPCQHARTATAATTACGTLQRGDLLLLADGVVATALAFYEVTADGHVPLLVHARACPRNLAADRAYDENAREEVVVWLSDVWPSRAEGC